MPRWRPSFARRLLAFGKAFPVGELQRLVHHGVVVAAVVQHAERVLVGQLLRLEQVAAAQLDAVEAELPRGDVDQPLHHVHHLGPAGAAVGPGRRGVAQHAAGAEMGGRHPIDARHDLDALLDHRVVAGARAEIADVVAAHREEIAVGIERELGLDREVAALIVAEQRFAAVRGPFHRAAGLPRGPGHQRLLGEDLAARAEIAADVADHQPHLVVGHAERRRQARRAAAGPSRCRCRWCICRPRGRTRRAPRAAPSAIRRYAAPRS